MSRTDVRVDAVGAADPPVVFARIVCDVIFASDNVRLAERSPPPVRPVPVDTVRVVGTALMLAGVMFALAAAVRRP